MKKLWLVLVPLLIAGGIYYFWLRPAAPQLPQTAALAPSAPITQPAASAPPAPAIAHPLDIPPSVGELPPLGMADDFIREHLAELLSAQQIKTHLLLENFARRVAATVDNLGRPLAPPSKWPIQTMPGRFTLDKTADGVVIGAKNAARYRPFVAMIEAVDSARAVALYHRLYPLFQRAYEELGYPGKYFNDRLVAVIDLLLQTPESAAALRVDLPEIRGPLQPTRPWVLYRFSDPALEGLTSGQKILLRTGPEHAKRLKAKLADLRKLISKDKPSS